MGLSFEIVIALALISPASGQTSPAPAPTENASPGTKKPPEATPKAQANPGPASGSTTTATSTGANSAAATSASAAAKNRKRTAVAPAPAPQKIVVREGGAREPASQIVPGMTPSEAERERQSAERWLNLTVEQLKQLSARSLQPQEQETVEQIRNYMAGARSALREGDVRRARTLAEKAHLLVDDLVKH
jgi:hypothetical protein